MGKNLKPTVVVLGGGYAGLEAAFALRARAGDSVAIRLVSDKDHFLFTAKAVYVPFGLAPEELRIPLRPATQRAGVEFIQARARRVDPTACVVELEGRMLVYDYLVVAAGARERPEEIPGLREHGHVLWGAQDLLRLRSEFESLLRGGRADAPRDVLFLVPPGNRCAGPLYELALMLDTWLRRRKARGAARITWTTCERGYLQTFGPRLDGVVAGEFARRGIEGHRQWSVKTVEADAVVYENGRRLPYGLLVSCPPYAATTSFPGLPADGRGFLQTVPETRQLKAWHNIYAVGDAGDFPAKQSFLAILQADAAAAHLAGALRRQVTGEFFVPMGLCVMDQLDRATFAQVPLRRTGDEDSPVEVDPHATRLYRVGTSRAWRLGRKLLAAYVPWRFRRGLPLRQGLPWRGIELALRLMSRVFAG